MLYSPGLLISWAASHTLLPHWFPFILFIPYLFSLHALYTDDSQIHTFSPELWSQLSILNLHPSLSPSSSGPPALNFIELFCSLNCVLWIFLFYSLKDIIFPPSLQLETLQCSWLPFSFSHIQAGANFFPSVLPSSHCIEFSDDTGPLPVVVHPHLRYCSSLRIIPALPFFFFPNQSYNFAQINWKNVLTRQASF